MCFYGFSAKIHHLRTVIPSSANSTRPGNYLKTFISAGSRKKRYENETRLRKHPAGHLSHYKLALGQSAGLFWAFMKLELISVGPYEVNCAVVWGETKHALIIDPGYNAADIEAVIKKNGLDVAAYLLTHGHADHIHALSALHAARPAPVYLHAADQEWAFGNTNQIPPCYSVPQKPAADFPTFGKGDLEFSKPWKISDLVFQTLETPGHTPGGVCYWFKDNGVCFTGDTLFRGSCGRTDLPGGSARALSASLKKLAETLPAETRIVAGHGLDSTMGRELATNFFIQKFNR